MNSYLTDNIIEYFKQLPDRIRKLAKKNYLLWKGNPQHPSIDFKNVKSVNNIYSIRIGLGYRALGTVEGEDIIWFWVGSHSDYDKLIGKG